MTNNIKTYYDTIERRFKRNGIKLGAKDRIALEQFIRPAFYGTSLQCPK